MLLLQGNPVAAQTAPTITPGGAPQAENPADGTTAVPQPNGTQVSPAPAQIPPADQQPAVTQPVVTPPVVAPDATAPAANPIDELRRRVDQLKTQMSDSQIEEDLRKEVDQLLMRATTDLESAVSQKAMIVELQNRIPELASKAEAARNPAPSEVLPAPDTLTTVDLEERRTAKEVQLTAIRQGLITPEAATAAAQNRKRDLQQQILTQKQALETAIQNVRALPTESATLKEAAARVAAEARRIRLATELSLAETSLTEIDTQLTLNLPGLQAIVQQRQIALLANRLDALKTELEERRKKESAEQLDKARSLQQQVENIADPEVRKIAELRLKYAALNDQITQKKIPQRTKQLQTVKELFDELNSQKRTIEIRVHKFGPSGTVGQELLNFQQWLPDVDQITQEMAALETELEDLTANQTDYFAALTRAELVAATVEDDEVANNLEMVEGAIEVIRSIQENNSQLMLLLGDLNAQQRELLALVEGWNEYVSEQALWLRSHGTLSLEDFTNAPATARKMVEDLAEGIYGYTADRGVSLWMLVLPALVAIVLLLAVQNRARRSLIENGELAMRRTCLSIRPTVRAILLTFGMAAEWPLMMMFLGNVVRFGSGGQGVIFGLGTALVRLSGIVLWLNFLRQLLRPQGLADCHFAWNDDTAIRLRHWLRTVIAVLSIPLFLLLIVRHCAEQDSGLERILFAGCLLLIAGLLARLLLPASNAFVSNLTRSSRLLKSTRVIWTVVLVLVPAALGILSAIGFHYTAIQLWSRLAITLVTCSFLLIAHELLLRWLILSNRETRLALAKERAQHRSTQQAETGTETASTIPPVPQEDNNLEMFGLQARSLLRNIALLTFAAALWAIWTDVLPALRVLERETAWNISGDARATTEDAADSDQETEIVPGSSGTVVTYGNLIMAIFGTVVTVIAVRQLPGLIEILILKRLHAEPGLRYAIKTVTRYTVLVIGVTFACHNVGLRWSQVQWLVAGLSVGLGFGLQEVFANFVCGIIILLERPVRIGDIVTIDGVSGVVSRIQIRATSITDWDRREYIVPNREFVTGKLLNWTLSDTTNRVLVNVGVAYGSDTDRARQIMLEVAEAHENVLKDPPPVATFETFGDSSLNLVLRAYLPNLDNRLQTITELHTQINKRFTEERISIPFPQRDLHVFMNQPNGSVSKNPDSLGLN